MNLRLHWKKKLHCDDDELDDVDSKLAYHKNEVYFYCEEGGRDKELYSVRILGMCWMQRLGQCKRLWVWQFTRKMMEDKTNEIKKTQGKEMKRLSVV